MSSSITLRIAFNVTSAISASIMAFTCALIVAPIMALIMSPSITPLLVLISLSNPLLALRSFLASDLLLIRLLALPSPWLLSCFPLASLQRFHSGVYQFFECRPYPALVVTPIATLIFPRSMSWICLHQKFWLVLFVESDRRFKGRGPRGSCCQWSRVSSR